MSREPEPFWKACYEDERADTFGPPSEEIRDLADRLPPSTEVLDVGCGDGRNALYLARRGLRVRAFDSSAAAIDKLHRAAARGLSIEAWAADIATFEFDRSYGLVIAHGVLHLLEPGVCDRFLTAAREHTLPAGVHVHAVFTDTIAPPPDLAPFVLRLFREGELRELYADWEVELFRSYVKEDAHPGSPPHRHAIDKLVARKPRT
jgi:tellurite methyltransferase